MTSKHTKGDWYLKGPDNIGDYRLQTDETIATIARINSLNSIEETKANASLISAAPDLLAALEMFAEEWPKRGSDNDVDVAHQMAVAAIAKAKSVQS